jgi:Flp pilus assembly protein TadG
VIVRTTARERSRGQGLVEFAIVLPIIALIVFGLLDLGRAVFEYNTVAQAARQAARTAMVDQDVGRVRTAAIAAAPTVGLAASNVAVCFKDSDSDQTDCGASTDDCESAGRVIGCLAIVEVSVDYQPMTPVISLFWSSLELSSTSIEPIEYVCPSGTKTTCP